MFRRRLDVHLSERHMVMHADFCWRGDMSRRRATAERRRGGGRGLGCRRRVRRLTATAGRMPFFLGPRVGLGESNHGWHRGALPLKRGPLESSVCPRVVDV